MHFNLALLRFPASKKRSKLRAEFIAVRYTTEKITNPCFREMRRARRARRLTANWIGRAPDGEVNQHPEIKDGKSSELDLYGPP
jgi:hypothetical protein